MTSRDRQPTHATAAGRGRVAEIQRAAASRPAAGTRVLASRRRLPPSQAGRWATRPPRLSQPATLPASHPQAHTTHAPAQPPQVMDPPP